MKALEWMQQNAVQYSFVIFVSSICSLCIGLLFSVTTNAAYAGLPTTWPESGNMKSVVSAGLERSERGNNQVVAPSIWLKVYTKTPSTHKTLSVIFSNECDGNKRFLVYRTTQKEQIINGSKYTGIADQGSGCGTRNITIPASMFQQKSKVTGHDGLYVALLNIRITNNPVESGPRSFFRINVTSGGAGLGSWGMYNAGDDSMLNELKAPEALKARALRAMAFDAQGPNDTIRYKFAPPCDFLNPGQQRDIYLDWSDDDRWGTSSPQFGDKKAFLTVYSPANRINMASNFITNRGTGFIKNFKWAGEGGNGYTLFPVVDNKKYVVEFENMVSGVAGRSNVLVVWYPFDSGDFDLSCPDPGWQFTLTTWESQKRNTIGFMYTNPNTGSTTTEKNNIKKENRKNAAETLRKVQFNHYLTNMKPAGGRDHITAPRANSSNAGCSGGMSYNGSYCARVQQRVWSKDQWQNRVTGNADHSSHPNWRWRFGDAGAGSENTTNNGFSRNIPQGQTMLVDNGWEGKTWYALPDNPSNSHPRHPSTYNDNGDGPSNIDNWLKNVEPGDVYCERLVVRNGASYETTRRESREGWGRCIMLQDCPANGGCVTSDYELTPSITTSPSRDISQGEIVTPKPSVEKEPASGSTKPTHWRVSRFTVPPDADEDVLERIKDMDDAKTGAQDACTWVQQKTNIAVCGANSEAGNRVFSTGTTNDFATNSDNTASVPIGTQYCYIMSVNSWEYDSSGWRHSRPSCVAIVKHPKVNFQNGDVRAGRTFLANSGTCEAINTPGAKITTSHTNIGGTTYASRVQYGAFATDSITSFLSGGYQGSSASTFLGEGNRLTFGNRNSDDVQSLGNFSYNSLCVGEDYFAKARTGATVDNSASFNLSTKNGKISTNRSGIITLSANGGIPKGRDITLYASNPSSALVIDSPIVYDQNGYSSGNLAELPRLTIVTEGAVILTNNATQVDARIVSKKTLYTCNISPNQLTISQCNNPLTINGPVAVKQLALRRTGGAQNPGYGAPAEIFNLRPDQILNSYVSSSSGGNEGQARTVFEKDLPPRY